MNLVVGATGFVGQQICRRLAAEGRPVRALVRPNSDPARVGELRALGAEIAEGDLTDRASLDAACRGAEAVLSTATTIARPGGDLERVDCDGQKSLVDAAAAAGARRFVFVSVSGGAPDDNPLIRCKREVEAHLKRSGMEYTILRPTAFMEVWLSPAVGFDYAAGTLTIFGSGEKRVSWISLADVAEFAVRCLKSDEAAGATIELGGPAALSPHDVAHVFEEVAGRSFELRHVPEEALQGQRAQASNAYEESFAALAVFVAGGDPVEMDATLRKFPVRLTSVREYAERSLASGGAA